MTDFAAARRTMVDGQLRTFDVTDQNVLAAVLAVPRERFVPADAAGIAYLDSDVAGRRARSAPHAQADGVCQDAPGSGDLRRRSRARCRLRHRLFGGRHLAVCANGSSPSRRIPDLARHARQNLAGAGAANVTVVEGPLAERLAAAQRRTT